MTVENQSATPPAAPPPAELTRDQQFEQALAKAFQDDGIVEKPSAPAAVETPKPVEAPKAAEAPKPQEVETPALAKIAQQMSALRKEREALAPVAQLAQVLPVDRVQLLQKALAGGNAVEALRALGFSHTQYSSQLLGEQEPAAPVEKEEPAPEWKSAPEIRELIEFKKKYEAEQAKEQNAKLLDNIGQALKKETRFKYLNGIGQYEDVLGIIGRFHADTGQLPGSTFEESVRIAAEEVELHLAAQAEKWSKVLTPQPAPASVAPKKAEEQPSTGTETPRTLTNSNTSAPAAVRPVPQTREESIEALLRDPEFEKLLR